MIESEVLARVRAVAADMKAQRAERQRRRHLDPADFASLADAGFFLTGVPAEEGGLWRGVPASIRLYSDLIYALAEGDPSVALVAAMHPAVLSGWLGIESAPEPFTSAWATQRAFAIASARDGAMWGTLTSEPGSGGDMMKTRARAERDPAGSDPGKVLLSGDKHFGSGSGIASYMITTALADGAATPSIYVMDMRGRAWDGTQGLTLLAEWDGHGMTATQSHAFRLKHMPATAIAWPGAVLGGGGGAGGGTSLLGGTLFTTVAVAIVEGAVALARQRLAAKKDEMRASERVGWTSIVNQAWTIRQVLNGMIAAVERGENATAAVSRGKAVVADLAETCLGQFGRVIGGGAFSRAQPFGQWAEDVRALGFLRPPWGLAFDQLFAMSWEG